MYPELANPFGEQDVKQTCRKFSFVLNENLCGNKCFKYMYWICGFCGLKLTLSERYFYFILFYFVKLILYMPLIHRFYCVGVIYAQRLQKTTFFLRDHSSIHSCFTATSFFCLVFWHVFWTNMLLNNLIRFQSRNTQ